MKALWQQIPSVEITRIYCNTNFDAVVLDLEHGVFNNETLFSLIQNKYSFSFTIVNDVGGHKKHELSI